LRSPWGDAFSILLRAGIMVGHECRAEALRLLERQSRSCANKIVVCWPLPFYDGAVNWKAPLAPIESKLPMPL